MLCINIWGICMERKNPPKKRLIITSLRTEVDCNQKSLRKKKMKSTLKKRRMLSLVLLGAQDYWPNHLVWIFTLMHLNCVFHFWKIWFVVALICFKVILVVFPLDNSCCFIQWFQFLWQYLVYEFDFLEEMEYVYYVYRWYGSPNADELAKVVALLEEAEQGTANTPMILPFTSAQNMLLNFVF